MSKKKYYSPEFKQEAVRLAQACGNKSQVARDRGSQYASFDYQRVLQQKGIVASMSRRGNCYDNAPTESWFATLKRELVYRTSYATHAQARQGIFEYIEVWYNRQRKHSAIRYKSPVAYEEQWKKSTPNAA